MTVGVEREGLFEATCPHSVDKPSITVRWQSVGFVHWAFDPDAVARILPSDVAPDLYGGRAWAGYRFATVLPGGGGSQRRSTPVGPLRWPQRILAHHEARAAVAVVDRQGRPGLWYLSIDTDGKLTAAGMRRWLDLPAYEAESRFSTSDDRHAYWSQRPDGTTARLKLTVGPATAATDVDRFLTARWRIVLPRRWWDPEGATRIVTTAHQPWTLHRASVEFFDDDMLMAGGLPPAVGVGLALWSPGTSVVIGSPRRHE